MRVASIVTLPSSAAWRITYPPVYSSSAERYGSPKLVGSESSLRGKDGRYISASAGMKVVRSGDEGSSPVCRSTAPKSVGNSLIPIISAFSFLRELKRLGGGEITCCSSAPIAKECCSTALTWVGAITAGDRSLGSDLKANAIPIANEAPRNELKNCKNEDFID